MNDALLFWLLWVPLGALATVALLVLLVHVFGPSLFGRLLRGFFRHRSIPGLTFAVLGSLVAISLSGCAVFHIDRSWYRPASGTAQKECRRHCALDARLGALSALEADESAGACWLACASKDDPWYIEQRDLREMSNGELFAHGFCRAKGANGEPLIDPFRGKAIVYLPINWKCVL